MEKRSNIGQLPALSVWKKPWVLVATLTFLVGCSSTHPAPPETSLPPAAESATSSEPEEPAGAAESSEGDISVETFMLTSPAFAQGEHIPVAFTCDGANISVALEWFGAPAGTVSFALIMDDPDAPSGDFVHWVLYNVPTETAQLPQAVAVGPTLVDGSLQGSNGAGVEGYTGPCPPSGVHRYFFKLYALSIVINQTGLDKPGLLAAMEGAILAQTELMGTYTRE
jgi:hypothetical protein